MWDFLLYDVPWCNGSTTDFGSVGWGFESLRDNLGGSSVGRALHERILVKESNSEPFSNCSDKAVVAGSSPALPTNVGVAEVVSCAALIRRRRRFESFHRHKYRKADITFLPYVGRFRLRVYDKTLLYAGLAQLVQSICLTSRGSLVRIHHPAHIRAISSVGRTSALHAECRGFESHMCPR